MIWICSQSVVRWDFTVPTHCSVCFRERRRTMHGILVSMPLSLLLAHLAAPFDIISEDDNRRYSDAKDAGGSHTVVFIVQLKICILFRWKMVVCSGAFYFNTKTCVSSTIQFVFGFGSYAKRLRLSFSLSWRGCDRVDMHRECGMWRDFAHFRILSLVESDRGVI